MKHNFMNKENGKVASVLVMYLDDDGHMQADSYDKVEDFVEDYASYEPAKPEPLIKDEKIRKAVRAWAEANDYSLVKIGNDMASEPNYGNVQIHFEDVDIVDEDKYGVHTIAELCGEGEE